MPSSRMRILIAAAAATVTALTLAGCSSSGGDDAASAEETVTVKVGTLRGQPHFYQPFLYNDYAEDGVKFEVVTLDTTPALSDALVSGSIDFAISGVTPSIASIAQDRDLKIVASAADGGSGFIGNGETSLDELTGEKIGIIQGSAQEVALRLLIDEAGMTPEDFELTPIPVPEMAAAFTAGDIAAFMGVEIGVSIAKGNGGTEVLDPYSTEIGKVNIGLITTGAYIEENPEVVQKVVDTHAATTEYMADNIEEWLPGMVEEFGGDEAVFTSALENFWLRSDLSDEYVGQLEALATAMAEIGLIDEAPGADDIVDTSFAP
ncbi:NitT/TauT family transport system substrate-binding protein [Microbacterium terrae]|uniref:Aliphatic sulfonates-binding protein n=1 Tax=Microbacterium terrae TaxID=69369 RepID=A0A0M2HIT7_9MICO|nr:NrtA/SsuA/CpmA family ABC transporter substrate-binding protein [Microbacterium terrae]KJL44246.1 putative aliphatic sulfonates-binding protein precursor [Microbacterium terrae]MBP1078786.1 NitT/TauT family transport system substrate-binding protein [Microbacterium terrae]GLJ98187.1 ABC transporter substrate-binding protein [Microbacterium terrae]